MFDSEEFVMEFFSSPKVHFLLDGQFGSSGKGKLAYWLTKRQKEMFSCSVVSPNAGHTIVDGGKYFLQQLTTHAILDDPDKKIYLGPGSMIDVGIILSEIERNGILPSQLFIDPMAMIIEPQDIRAEGGAGISSEKEITSEMAIGSTLHGVGKARQRKIGRGASVKLARDIDELREYVHDREVRYEIINECEGFRRLPGLCEISQGFGLGIDERYYPRTTSRNCTVQQSLDGLGIPPYLVGNVIINLRTFPIRVNSNKYVDNSTGNILTDYDIEDMSRDQYTIIEGYSGDFYEDSVETSWEELGLRDRSGDLIIERTSVSKLERRVASFSKINVVEAILSNLPPDPYKIYLSLNFVNYLNEEFYGINNKEEFYEILSKDEKSKKWFMENICGVISYGYSRGVPDGKIGNNMVLGTGPEDDHTFVIDILELSKNLGLSSNSR